jgi:hypothetical protein
MFGANLDLVALLGLDQHGKDRPVERRCRLGRSPQDAELIPFLGRESLVYERQAERAGHFGEQAGRRVSGNVRKDTRRESLSIASGDSEEVGLARTGGSRTPNQGKTADPRVTASARTGLKPAGPPMGRPATRGTAAGVTSQGSASLS